MARRTRSRCLPIEHVESADLLTRHNVVSDAQTHCVIAVLGGYAVLSALKPRTNNRGSSNSVRQGGHSWHGASHVKVKSFALALDTDINVYPNLLSFVKRR